MPSSERTPVGQTEENGTVGQIHVETALAQAVVGGADGESEVYPLEPRRYYFDFGDGTNVISSEQVVSHVYTGFGTFSVRVVETDTPRNITSGATVSEFQEIVIYVYNYFIRILWKSTFN